MSSASCSRQLSPPPLVDSLRCLWYGVDVSATDSTRRLLPPLGLVSKPYCLTSLSDLKNSYLWDCLMLKTQSHSLPPAKQFLMNCNDVEDSVPLSSTSEAVPYEL